METPLLKIDSIHRCLRRVRDVAARDPSLRDVDVQDLVVLNLQRACEQAIDLANWVCAHRRLDVPRTSAEVYEVLERHGVLVPAVARSMRKMVGFRNIAVHEYRRLDPRIVASIVAKRLVDFDHFIAAVAQVLGIQQVPARAPEVEARTRYVQLTLARLSRAGEDLGRDLELEIQVNDQRLVRPLPPSSRDNAELAIPLAHVRLQSDATQLPLHIVIRETDPVYDDVGAADVNIPLVGEGVDDQLVAVDVKVAGRGPTERKKHAQVMVVFRLVLHEGVAFVTDVPPDGWLKVKLDGGPIVAISHAAKVMIISIEGQREKFRILEGPYAGKAASAAVAKGGGTHFTAEMPRFDACHLGFDRKTKRLEIEELGTFAAEMSKTGSILPGTYELLLPDMPHDAGAAYRNVAPHAKTWFRIGKQSDRYLHAGRLSKGCIAIKEISEWEKIYHRLVYCRGDLESIGDLVVT